MVVAETTWAVRLERFAITPRTRTQRAPSAEGVGHFPSAARSPDTDTSLSPTARSRAGDTAKRASLRRFEAPGSRSQPGQCPAR